MRRCCCRHRATDTDNAPEAAGRRGGRAAATFAVGVLHDVETRRGSRGRRARRRRRPRPQPLQLPFPKQLSLPSCTTALSWRQHASDGELPALLKSQARTEERRADVARGVSSRSAEERRRFASDSIISRRRVWLACAVLSAATSGCLISLLAVRQQDVHVHRLNTGRMALSVFRKRKACKTVTRRATAAER